MTTLTPIQALIAHGESETLEFKRSTAQLRRAGETLRAFLNGEGGQLLIGVGADGRGLGQQVADSTLRDLAGMLGRFEPPAPIKVKRVDVGAGKEVLVHDAPLARQLVPYLFGLRPHRGPGSTTTRRGEWYGGVTNEPEAQEA